MSMVIDHIGIVVKSLEDGINQWINTFGYNQMTDPVVNTLQQVKVVFMCKEKSIQVKLVEPLNDQSPIYRFARRGGGMHHLCFRANNLEEQIGKFQDMKNEIKIIVSPQPGEAFNNENIAFALAKNNLNIELIDTNEKACVIRK
jgi:methylmalonyl-CoA/ethylmalonyl-CoA epimerase